jgi:hypothetical protein
MIEKLACISVDLDELDCYAAIHGLDPSLYPAGLVYSVALERFAALFRELGMNATLFAIGRDLESEANADTVREMHAAGHEIGNHSYHHAYDLTRKTRNEIHDDISRGAAIIERVTGERPRGFRAPGYTINDTVFDVLRSLHTHYDSSVFPCPAYYSAKAVAMAAIRVRGRASRSVLDDPRVLIAPADPYRVGTPYYSRGDGLIELPIGVTPTLRLPYIGTSVLATGERGARLLSKQMSARPFVNLELHGIDLLDASDGLAALAKHQPDLRVPTDSKRRTLHAAIRTLRDSGFRFVTLAEAATAFSEP